MRASEKLLADQNERLRFLVEELAFWARRYADGRSTYAPSSVNQAIDTAKALGCDVRPDKTLADPEYATDGGSGAWKNGKFFKECAQVSQDPTDI